MKFRLPRKIPWYMYMILAVVMLVVSAMVLLSIFAIGVTGSPEMVWEEAKIEYNIRTKGHPFTDEQYKNLIAEDRQTSKGFRKEWLDNLENGDLRKIIEKIPGQENQKKISDLVETNLRSNEKILRSLDKPEVVIEASNSYSDFIECLSLYAPRDWRKITSEIRNSQSAHVRVAMLYRGKHLRFRISEPSTIKSKRECDEKLLR